MANYCKKPTIYIQICTILLVLSGFSQINAQTINWVTNHNDPFGPLPATTTNLINTSIRTDLMIMIYDQDDNLIRRLYNDLPAGTTVTGRWHGDNDQQTAQPAGTYYARTYLNRQLNFVTSIQGNGVEFASPADIAVDRYGNVYGHSLCFVQGGFMG